MEAGQPSRTAQGAALHRAAHQLVDRPPVFADPLALKIVGREAANALLAGSDPHTAMASSALRAFIAVRSRYAEDCFSTAMRRGVHHYVLLGAGLDTFAYRRAAGSTIKIFEVDHPATQIWKRARLKEALIGVPENLVFAPVDFEQETIVEGLARAGLDMQAPAFFAWLGVVPYLTRDTIRATLTWIASAMTAGSEIVFDYAEPVPEGIVAPSGLADLAARVAALGEPLRSFFDPSALAEELRKMGFSAIEDLDAAALNMRYFRERTDGLQLRGRGHVTRALV